MTEKAISLFEVLSKKQALLSLSERLWRDKSTDLEAKGKNFELKAWEFANFRQEISKNRDGIYQYIMFESFPDQAKANNLPEVKNDIGLGERRENLFGEKISLLASQGYSFTFDDDVLTNISLISPQQFEQ